MKGGMVVLLYYFMTLALPVVNGQRAACSRAFASGSVEFERTPMNVRRRGELLNIAHGNTRTAKCRFLGAVLDRTGLSGECGPSLSTSCPAPRRRAFGTAMFGFAGAPFGIPADCPMDTIACDIFAIYRTHDGSCNNLGNPRWGQAESQERRYLPNAYDDGVSSMKTMACNGGTLPNPRTVSNMIHSAGPGIQFENFLSLFAMQMGQFLVHDVVVTKVFTRDDGSALKCCGADMAHPECAPITIPLDDTFFDPGSCMDFARSNAVFDCSSIRQQVNSQTSYFDLSVVYGSSDAESATLRANVGGLMKHVQTKLPVDPTDSTCFLTMPFDPLHYYCPIAGDGRVNEQPGLASMHTIFMREHNRLATDLAFINPHWNHERLYQEARKINIAQWQNIVYAEFLPAILGQGVLNSFNLNVPRFGYNDNYNPFVDATIANAFAVGVFRYGHSQVQDFVGMFDSFHNPIGVPQPLERHFFEPLWYHADNGQGLENILHWTTSTGCPFTDRKLQDSIRQKLFLDANGDSFDLATLNIHRGRDHGMPGYTAFRELCGLSQVFHFGVWPGGLIDHDPEAASLLEQTYACPGDIDLFTGLLTERRTGGSVLGPTWQCLLATEFRKLRDGDRFFFERRDPGNPATGFTLAQLNSIKSIKATNIICRNTKARFMQPNAFFRPNIGLKGKFKKVKNRFVKCKHFRGVNLKLWKEFKGAY